MSRGLNDALVELIAELYAWLQANKVTTDHIINLLYQASINNVQLRRSL